MINVAVFVSGRGSNLRAIVEFFNNKPKAPKIKYVISDKINCPALDFARNRKIATYVVKKNAWKQASDILREAEIDLIVLAGFLKKIPDEIVREYPDKIINIHPALLPSFGGKGMYGMNVHEAVFKSSAKVSGATVHFVNEKYDEGKIIAQECVDISDVKTPEEIAERVLEIEHRLLPSVIEKFSLKKIITENGRIVVL